MTFPPLDYLVKMFVKDVWKREYFSLEQRAGLFGTQRKEDNISLGAKAGQVCLQPLFPCTEDASAACTWTHRMCATCGGTRGLQEKLTCCPMALSNYILALWPQNSMFCQHLYNCGKLTPSEDKRMVLKSVSVFF